VGLELHLYDFDGTLFRSPDRPDWWGRESWVMNPASMGPPCVPEKPGNEWWVGSVVSAAKKSIADPDVWAILCTGRSDAPQTGNRYRIPMLLKQRGLNFDEVYLNPGQDTAKYKIDVMDRILARNPGIETVRIWEDHDVNLPRFVKHIESKGLTCVGHFIRSTHPDPLCTEADMDEAVTEGWNTWKKRARGKVIFTEVLLSRGAQQDLFRWWDSLGVPRLPKPSAHHMTIAFKPGTIEGLPVGKEVLLKVIGWASSDRVQAVAVKPQGVASTNAIPHVTVALAPGAKPFESNALLKEGFVRANGPVLRGVVGYFNGREHVTESPVQRIARMWLRRASGS